jgi:hypothetical protein
MGRKPVLGLVGACLASMALTGCENGNCCLWPDRNKKDNVTAAGGTGGGTGWSNQRQGQTGLADRRGSSGSQDSFQGGSATGTGGSAGAGAGGSGTWGGTAGSGGSGSFNVNRGPADDYPVGRSQGSGAGATGAVDRVGYPGTDAGSRTTAPGTTTNNFNDQTAPPMTPRIVGGAPDNLPPLKPQAPPKGDDFSAGATGRGSAAPTTPLPPVGTGGASGTSDMPPPAPTPAETGAGTEPLPPLPPTTPTTRAYQSPPLPTTPAPAGRNVGVPTSPVQPATIGGPSIP